MRLAHIALSLYLRPIFLFCWLEFPGMSNNSEWLNTRYLSISLCQTLSVKRAYCITLAGTAQLCKNLTTKSQQIALQSNRCKVKWQAHTRTHNWKPFLFVPTSIHFKFYTHQLINSIGKGVCKFSVIMSWWKRRTRWVHRNFSK